jgi:hypothetical protein
MLYSIKFIIDTGAGQIADPQYYVPAPVVQPSKQYMQQTEEIFLLTQPVAPQIPICRQQQPIIQNFQQQSQDLQVSHQQGQSEWTAVINKKLLRSPELPTEC